MHIHTVSLVVLLAMAIANAAWAQEPRSADTTPNASAASADEENAGAPDGDADAEQARGRYKEAAAAYAAGRYLEAIDMFQEVALLRPSPDLSYNIGLAYEAMGNVPQALRWYRDYLRRVPDAQDRAEVERAVRRLEETLLRWGVQQVTIMSTPSGAAIEIDGKPIGVTPWTGEIAPDQHRIVFRLDGYADSVVEFTLPKDRATDIRVTLNEAAPEPPAAAPPPPAAPPPKSAAAPPPTRDEASARGPGTLTWVTLGVGAAALAGAVAFEVQRSNAEDDARAAPTQVAAAEKIDTRDQYRTTSRVLAGVGGAFVIAGSILWMLDLSAEPSRDDTSTSVGLACTLGSCSLTARGSF